MAKIKNPNANPAPMWPWGELLEVRERKLDPAQLRARTRKAGNAKVPVLPSAELMKYIGPADSSDHLRLPMPPPPRGHDADIETFMDRPHLGTVCERAEQRQSLERGLSRVHASPERFKRMSALLGCEAEMHAVLIPIAEEMQEILSKMWEAQKDENL